METCLPTTPESGRHSGHQAQEAGFSLVEVSLAIGIVAFGIMAVFGLFPAGMGMFRQSIDRTVSSQILQQVINEAQATDFDELITDKSNQPIPVGSTGVKAIRYFDDQGRELASSTGAIFCVNTRIQPATDSPANPSFTNINLATVTIQVAKRPGNGTLAYETDSELSNLWNGARQGTSGTTVSILTASTMVSRQ